MSLDYSMSVCSSMAQKENLMNFSRKVILSEERTTVLGQKISKLEADLDRKEARSAKTAEDLEHLALQIKEYETETQKRQNEHDAEKRKYEKLLKEMQKELEEDKQKYEDKADEDQQKLDSLDRRLNQFQERSTEEEAAKERDQQQLHEKLRELQINHTIGHRRDHRVVCTRLTCLQAP
eukprot:Lankesteria_metandrocarpae@DN4512_c0_g1_i2.p2